MEITKELVQDYIQSLNHKHYDKWEVVSINDEMNQNGYIEIAIKIDLDCELRYVNRNQFDQWLVMEKRYHKIEDILTNDL